MSQGVGLTFKIACQDTCDRIRRLVEADTMNDLAFAFGLGDRKIEMKRAVVCIASNYYAVSMN